MQSKTAIFIAVKVIAITTLINAINQGSHLAISLSQGGMPISIMMPTIVLLLMSGILWFGASSLANTITGENNKEIEIEGLTPYDLYKAALSILGVFIIVSVLPEILRSIATIVTLGQQMQTEMIYNQKIATYILFFEMLLGFVLVFKSNIIAKLINNISK